MELNDLTERIIGCAIKVHRALGPGLLESTYETCLVHELIKSGMKVERQVAVPIFYDGLKLKSDYYLDVLVEDTVILELKSVEALIPIFEAQLLTYMKLANKKLGLLINFNVTLLKYGIKRKIL
jgi:GxxExxY protein